MHKIRFIAQKELYHILRDPRSLIIVFAMPVMMVFLYGYAINLDMENITLALIDLDKTSESRALAERFFSTRYFAPPDVTVSLNDPEAALRSGKANAVLVISPGFARALQTQDTYELGMLIDGSDNSMAAAVQAYGQAMLGRFLASRLPAGAASTNVTISHQVLFNPDLKSSHFFVPGLVAIILLMISTLLTSITIAREKETGTMEQLLTAPVRTHEILIGKLLPYTVIAFIDGLLVLLFAKVVFGVPFVGSGLLMALFTLIYVTTALSLGILISSLVKTQQVAMMFALVATVLPSVMLSGFIFQIKNMPVVLQVIASIVPAKFFLTAVRGIMLKGTGLAELWPQAVYLTIIMVVLLVVATRRFTTRVG